MGRPAEDLARWMPRLLAVWRRGRKAPPRGPRPPADRLSPQELAEVAGAVERLSHGLTRDRRLAGARYLDDEKLLGAYLLFYWPVSYLQARGVLSELPAPPRRLLDLGSGPGPMALAALDAGASHVVAADRSERALAAARALAEAAGQKLVTRRWDGARGAPLSELAGGHPLNAVTLGHVLNELGTGEVGLEARTRLLSEAARLLAPGGSVVVVEPALRETSRALLQVRDRAVAAGFAVRAPCLFRGPCPALLKESDWCHAERPVEPPPLVAEIAAAAGLRREAVKMSYLLLAPPGEPWAEPPPGRVFRIVSEPLPGKGRMRFMGCGPEGRMGLALQEKHLGDANRRFASLLRGDLVELGEVEPRGDGLRLSAHSSVRVLAEAGSPVPPAGGEAPAAQVGGPADFGTERG